MTARFIITLTLAVAITSMIQAADWQVLSQSDFGANGIIELDDVVVASWSATMDPVSGFNRAWFGPSDDEGLFIGMAGDYTDDQQEALITVMVNPMPGYVASPMQWGQSRVPIHTIGGTLEFSGFTGAARLLNDGSTGTYETDPPGPEIVSPAVGTASTQQPFVVTRRDGLRIQNPDWIVETPFDTGVSVLYTTQADPIQVVANEAITVDVNVSAVPEPSSSIMAFIGVLGLMKLRRRK